MVPGDIKELRILTGGNASATIWKDGVLTCHVDGLVRVFLVSFLSEMLC
jgi:hypothetical protein